MAGKRLLITGGAGFLGHYLVQAVTPLEPLGQGRADPRDRLRQLLARRAGLADEAAGRECRRRSCGTTWASRCRRTWAISSTSSTPRRSRRRRITAATRSARWTPTSTACGTCSTTFLAQKQAGKPALGFLFFSSSEIYGDPDPANIPTREDYRGCVSCTGPRACYDEAKRYGETLCVNFARQHGLPVKAARPFNNYGPGLKITDGRVIPDFARDVFAGRDIVMLSDGSPMRTFCYVADAVIGYLKVLVKGQPGEGVQHRHRDAGDLDGATWRRKIAALGEGTVRLRRQGRHEGQQRRRLPRSTTPTAAARSSRRRERIWASTRRSRSTKACAAR